MQTSLIDQCLKLKLSATVLSNVSKTSVRARASVMGEVHGYAVEQAVLFAQMTVTQHQQAGLKALGKLRKKAAITASEAGLIADCLRLPDRSRDVAVHVEGIEAAHRAIHGSKLSSPVAMMLVGIALDSSRRDLRLQPPKPTSKGKGAGRQKRQAKKKIMAWVADVAAGTVGAVVGGAGGIPGALIVGTVAAGAASGAVLK